MRRLTLILSDLYLDAEHASESVPQTHVLPALEWLLRFAQGPERVADWRRWLLHELGVREARPGGDCLATPVQLEARLDHVRLVDRGLLRIETEERAQWCAAFNETFAPEYQLHDCNERAFILRGLPAADVATIDPARLLGADIGPAVPGANAPQLRRLWAEIEMWLHGASLNALRERAGKRRISALWLWGQEAADGGELPRGEAGPVFYGADPLFADARRDDPAHGVPARLADVDESHEHVVVEFAPLTGAPYESLPSLDANWFAPARAALVARRLEVLQLVANDRVFRVTARNAWRFWRRSVSWLDALASS